MWEAAVLEVGGLLSGEDNKDAASWVIRLSALGVVRLLVILPCESADIWASSFLHLDSS